MQIKELLKKLGQTVHTIPHDETVGTAVRMMTTKGVRTLIVTDRDQTVGIVTQGDLLRCHQPNRKTQYNQLDVAKVMTTQLITATPGEPIQSAIATMTKARIRHLPVFEEHRVVGILATEDLMAYQLDLLRLELQELKEYIVQLHDAAQD